ncbi:MAG: hypothetical protein K6G88_05980 [Lachnospiraceae bacterium]|nr:hypothetical protein [Lachnospiraceae bacterium]
MGNFFIKNVKNQEIRKGIEKMESQAFAMRGILNAFYDNMDKLDWSRRNPSTLPADILFLEGFITDDMYFEFEHIGRDFLNHCYDRLEEFSNVAWYENCDSRFDEPDQATDKRILRLILNGSKINDEYCIALLKYLYKTYYRQEYNQLKRFNKITAKDIENLKPLTNAEDYWFVARTLVMSRILGIEMADNCVLMYMMLDSFYNEVYKPQYVIPSLERKDVFDECSEQFDKWVNENKHLGPIRAVKFLRKDLKFIEDCLAAEMYPVDYFYKTVDDAEYLDWSIIKTMELLKTLHPKIDYSFEEVQHYTALYMLVNSIVSISDKYDFQMEMLLKENPIEVDEENKVLFNPENIIVSSLANKPKTEDNAVKALANVAPVKSGEIKEEELLKEIAELRDRLNKKEQQYSNLTSLYNDAKRSKFEFDQLFEKYNKDREELIALREYAYKSKQVYEKPSEVSVEEMKEFIKQKDIVVIGGHTNWLNKLKEEFPNWILVSTEGFKQVDGKQLEGRDKVYFYTEYISHSSYGKFISEIRKKKIPFGYIGNLNIEAVTKQIYDDLKD